MSKTIRFGENSLIVLKNRLNEITVGTDGVNPNNVITLWHGTDIPGILGILKSGVICASDGKRHGETEGMNWFSTKESYNFSRGVVFTIDVPSDVFEKEFRYMNNSEVTTRRNKISTSGLNLRIVYFCDKKREKLIEHYNRLVKEGIKYPIEHIRDNTFYNWCIDGNREDLYTRMSDDDFGLIMANIFGEDAVRKEGFIDESVIHEVSAEADEYTIGMEQGGGPGLYAHAEEADEHKDGDYIHSKGLNESKISYVNLSDVGEVVIEDWTYDEEEYQEWLSDNEFQDTPESKINYIEDYNVEFEVNFLDNQTYHTMCCEWVYYDDLVSVFGKKMADTIKNGMIESGSFKFDTTDLYADENYDINNPQELDDIAMKLLPHGEYFKGCRGFILRNGVVVYTEGEHNDVLRIPGIDSKWQFIELGNIRLLPNSIDIGSEPTYEQEQVLKYMLRLYGGEEIYLDIFSEKGEIGVHYPSADSNYIMGEIDRYYSEGIRPQGGEFYESKQDNKKILVSERQLLALKENTFETWFGNSILKDEKGNPIKMYHGTDAEFDSFSKEFIGRTGAYEGYGFNFTPYESRARGYNSKNVIEAYLKVEKPMTTNSYKITPSKLAKIISEIDKDVPYTDTIVAAYEPARYNENWDERYYRRALPVVARQLIQYNKENEYGDAGIYAEICLCGNGDKLKVIDTFEKLGYDSAIFYDKYGKINTVVVFEPNQIKRTSNKTFSIDSDVMNENGVRPQGNMHESKDKKHSNLIIESQETKSIAAAKNLVMQRLGYDEKKADDFVRIKLRNYLPALKTPQGGKFILGATRMYCDGEVRTASDNSNLNSTLKLVASDAHINEYDRNLNGMSYLELIQRFAKAMSDNLEAEKNEISKMVFDTPSDYDIVRIDSFEQAQEYSQYVLWCVTHDENMFNSYTNDGINQFYFCLKNGFENVEKVKSEGCPLDEYGLSMIAVSVNENGMLNTCTCRWNHDNGGNDGIMNSKQVSKVISMNFFEVFKPNNKWKELLANVMQRLANGEEPTDVFDYADFFKEGFARVALNNKYNFINQEGKFLSDQWFDNAGNFSEGFAMVELNRKWNFINQESSFLSDQWFDNIYDFREGFAMVELNRKWNFINQEGRLLSNQWFDNIYDFREGFTKVQLNNKFNFISQEGRLLSNQWFDDVNYFSEGFVVVELNGKWNFSNQEGGLLSDQWFDYVYNFREGFARVKLNGKWNFINQEGRIISNQWFNSLSDFHKGFAWVELNGKYNFINQEGKLLSDQWFDGPPYNFKGGFAIVKLNGRKCKIDTNGNLTLTETVNKNKVITINENQLKKLNENLEFEVDSSEVDLSSFKKKDSLQPSIWKDNETLDSKIRLKLLDIADDFWEFVNLTWVEPKGIILTGSICNFNWSRFSDIDLHLIVDFNEIDEKTEFVKDYLDMKKNDWNERHNGLKIMDFPVELYVQNIDDKLDAGGIYDLEENKWIRKPNIDDIQEIMLNKYGIKEKAAEIMTIIDDMYDALNGTDDSYEIEQIGNDAEHLWKKVKQMRKDSLSKSGEMSDGNIIYKYMRRTGYIDKLFSLMDDAYDKTNTINESLSMYDKFKQSQGFRSAITRELIKDGYVVHGTGEKWDAFLEEKIDRTMYGYGAYFTSAAYKFEEFGNEFVFLNINDFNLLNLDEKVNGRKNIFSDSIAKYKHLYDMLDYAKNNREYDHYQSLIDEYKENVDYTMVSSFAELASKMDGASYRTLNKKLIIGDYARNFEEFSKRISNMYLSLGFDGFVTDNIYCIFNFKKLNENIVKDKDELIARYTENQVSEMKGYIKALKDFSLNEEVVADGNSEHNPYAKRWKAERDALKNFLNNYGRIMTSKENGKQYKVYYDKTMSELIGYNYCICIQWDPIKMEVSATPYIRALDKFTYRIFQAQYDTRGHDNMRGTYDDIGNYYTQMNNGYYGN